MGALVKVRGRDVFGTGNVRGDSRCRAYPCAELTQAGTESRQRTDAVIASRGFQISLLILQMVHILYSYKNIFAAIIYTAIAAGVMLTLAFPSYATVTILSISIAFSTSFSTTRSSSM
jgi:hypothetical protein